MLLWFRNDLRIHDNPALHYFLHQTSTIQSASKKALFFVSSTQWNKHGDAKIKVDLALRHVNGLAQELQTFGIELLVAHCETFDDQVTYLTNYCAQHSISEIVVNEQPEINEQQRDIKVRESGLTLTCFESDVIVPKGRVLNQSGEMFKVFTPFKKAWLKHVREYGFDYIDKEQVSRFQRKQIDSAANKVSQVVNTQQISNAWPLVDVVEQQVIPAFLQDKFYEYHQERDIPSVKGTSGLSPYLAIGALSPRYLLRQILSNEPDLLLASDQDKFVWLNELIWREFYRHLLHHFPRLCKGKNFNSKYDGLKWRDDDHAFSLWCEGKTGYPIVDAAMRQLNQTGWMHNRLRMIVASFLTKHLLIDWRKGEQYFMSQLIDGDLAANNGGWQWAASTGCDAQPYFRIFNPIRQSEKFDPDGTFIRKYLPELHDIPNKYIHFPHAYLQELAHDTYWPAMVDHKAARERALATYKEQ